MVVRLENQAFDADRRRLFHRLTDARARQHGLCGALAFASGRAVLGVQGGEAGAMRFTAFLSETADVEPAVAAPRQKVVTRLFATGGLVMPWLRPGEAAWLETALKGDPRRDDRILAFLSWTALRHAEGHTGLYGAATSLAEAWSPFDGAEEETNPASETNLLTPS
ncbi:MAG: hypothetical protein ACK4MI_08240 [Brevundimonas sp.]|uniref:hypothetical protein n=1 Tax=Brevundimonas sp. TaxID=1871086 RepID=UPI0028D13D3E|nr:hypothetical protein [uncultured Brevundimonas sp.]